MKEAVTTASLLFGAFVVLLKLWNIGQREKGLPKGPPTLPLLGNLLDFPKSKAHFRLTEWARSYGDIYSLKLGPSTVIVLSSAKAVKEFMDDRSANTADRPPLYLANEISGGLHIAVARYSAVWRALRRTAHTILTPQGSEKHIPLQLAENTQLLWDIAHDPSNWYNHIRRTSNSTIVSILYGKRCPRYESQDATEFFEMEEKWEHLLAAGSAPPIDLLPILKFVPERWAAWKTESRKLKNTQRALYDRLLSECEQTVASGEEVGCFLEEIVKRQTEFGLTRDMTAYLGGTLIEGGSDTTATFLQTLVLALVAFPEVQRLAHEEMDSVVGSRAMPTLHDVEKLPYLRAVIKEIHRWRPMLPLAFPHYTLADDTYREFAIPKCSTLFMNVWGIYHDSDAFESPDQFMPERFLRSEFGTREGFDDRHFRHWFGFGSGRRMCPGIHVGQYASSIGAMFLVWAFDFGHAIDPDTKQSIPVDISDYSDGLIAPPRRFKCSIKTRGKTYEEIITHEFAAAAHAFSPFEHKLDQADREWVRTTRGML